MIIMCQKRFVAILLVNFTKEDSLKVLHIIPTFPHKDAIPMELSEK